MTTDMFRLVYTSTNRLTGGEDEVAREVAEILAASKRNNVKAGVTGALMFNGGVFAQVLEGPRKAVEATFERIQRDNRHDQVTVLHCAPATERSFPNWSMAFVGRSDTGRALWDKLAGQSGFDPSKLNGDDVYAVLRRILIEEEGPVLSKPASGLLDTEKLRAELMGAGRPAQGHAASPAAPPAAPRAATPSPSKPPLDVAPVDPELGVLRAALAEERGRTTALRGQLDAAGIALAKQRVELDEVKAERRKWAHRARLMAEALEQEAAASLQAADADGKAASGAPQRRAG